MTVLIETIHEGAFIVSEAPGFFSRDTIVVSTALSLVSGTVLGKTGNPSAETATVAADTNTGNGTLTLDATAPIGAAAADGAYKVELVSATAFNLLDPKGRIAGKGNVGQAFSGALKFLLAAGATPFMAGDSFTINVLRPDGVGDAWSALDPSGAIEAAGVLFSTVRATTPPATRKAVAMTRATEVRAADLTWPAGFTAAQIAEGTLQLKRLGIVQR